MRKFVPVCAGALIWIWWHYRPFRVEVEGDSMSPVLESGDWAIAIRATPGPGDVVVLEHPERPGFELVKRAIGKDASGKWSVQGDNPDRSTDSRSFGTVEESLIRGRVVVIYVREAGPGSIRLLRSGTRRAVHRREAAT